MELRKKYVLIVFYLVIIMTSDQSTNLFKKNFFFWKIFGIWGGRHPSKYYKYYSFMYLFVTYFCYNILLTLNLIYTPPKIELIVREMIFYFTEMVVGAKLLTIVLMRDNINEVHDLIDSDEFLCDYENKDGVLYKTHLKYKFYFTIYAVLSNIVYSSQAFGTIFVDLFWGNELELPICKYYFLSDEARQSYFFFWFAYQSFGMYGHMMYNVTIDTYIAGLLVIPITQLRILNNNLTNLKLTKEEKNASREIQDKIFRAKLYSYLRHYDAILKYCNAAQNLLSAALFFQFGIASIIICVVLCGLTLIITSTATSVFLVMYFFTMSSQIFVPGYLGTQLTHESEEIIFAAYNSEWMTRSEAFKSSLKLIMLRATTPITISGLKMFSLSLATFTSIMKTAYSFFTVIRNFQEK